MKLEKISDEILSIRKSISNKFTITNSKNETMDIDIVSYMQDDEVAGWDSDETIYDENEKEIYWNDIEDFIGEDEDIDELQEQINDLIVK